MKTYRLYSLNILHGQDRGVLQKDIQIEDGLIIDMEQNGKKWLVDVKVDEKDQPLFEEYYRDKEKLLIEVVITSPSNYPATMVAKVRKITQLNKKVSILLDGLLIIRKDDILDVILQGIVEEGLTGEELIAEFKQRKIRNSEAMKTAVEGLYNQIMENEELS
jgi:hypothetical protein